MRRYGLPRKSILIIKDLYDWMICKALHAGGLSESFTVNTGVKQGCLMAPFLFLLAIDWMMKETIREQRRGIQWNLEQQLDDLLMTFPLCQVTTDKCRTKQHG